ncbi:Arm DNA-binding domain-containing protein [Qipengyuania aurantiaca]|uniref:Arm DNA-binding domain-containing protein n=1 Tax=Qipengyuania aurantiaca TaxID=2867233 RepID=UPI003CD0DF3A
MLTVAQRRGAKEKCKDYKLTDADGLSLYLPQTGHRSWRYRYHIGGKQKQIVLGSHPELSIGCRVDEPFCTSSPTWGPAARMERKPPCDLIRRRRIRPYSPIGRRSRSHG